MLPPHVCGARYPTTSRKFSRQAVQLAPRTTASSRLGRKQRLQVLGMSIALALAGCTEAPRDVAYYLAHADVRTAKLRSCAELYNPSNDAQCRAAATADDQAIKAEHGPPFHGHDAAWYHAHYLLQLEEQGYCDSLRNRAAADPDCVAAAKQPGVHF